MKLKNLTRSAFFAAAIFAATAFVKIQLPLTGYIHLGDTFIFLACVFLPWPYAAVASGLGSALADLMSGYVNYIPVTFCVKLVMALVFKLCFGHKKTTDVLGAVAASVWMALGYFVYEACLYGAAESAVNIPFNFLQGAVCAALALPVAYALKRRSVL